MFAADSSALCARREARLSERRKWVKVFEACDEDNKGYLSREDFKVAVVMLFGYKPSKIEADSVMSAINSNTSGICLEEFIKLMEKKKAAQLYQNEVRQIFTAFDRQYRGFLTLEDFKKAFRQVAPRLPDRIVLEAFRHYDNDNWENTKALDELIPVLKKLTFHLEREVDQDSDGHVSFKDFEYAMNYGQNEA